MANPVISFLQEYLNRLFVKSPLFFKRLQLVAALLTFAGYVPSMLQVWFNVIVPGNIIHLCETISKYSTGFFAAALLPTQSATVAQTSTGDLLKVTDEKKLPFTAASEEKTADKQNDLPTLK